MTTITHLLKDQTSQEIRSKCGSVFDPKTQRDRLTGWASLVTCPECLERTSP